MSTSAAAGGSPMKSVKLPKGSLVVNSVAATAAAVYIFWKIRLRATEELGHAPRTLSPDWERATRERMSRMPMEGAPGIVVHMNPHYHSLPPSKSILHEQ